MARSSSTGSTSQGGLLSMPEQAPRRPSLWDHVPGLADPDRRSRMIIALQGMTMNPNEGLVHMAQGDLDASRKSAEQQRMMAWLAQQPGGEQFAAMMGAGFDANGVASAYLQSQAPKAPVIEGGMVFDPVTGEMIHDYRQQDGQDPTTAMQNYQALVALGVPSEDAIKQAFGSGGTTVNVGADGQRYAPPPTGYAVVEDPNSPAGVRYELIPGSEPAVEAANANAGAAETAQRESVQTRVVLQQVQGVRDILDNPGLVPDAGVFGQVMTGMGLNQQGQDLNNRLTTIKSAVAYDRLESLRAGGGMGQVSDTDMAMLGVALGNLDPSSSPQVLRESLDTIERVMGKIGGAAPQAAPQAAAPAPATSQPAPAAPQPAAQPQPAPAPATTAPDPQQAIAQVPLMNWQQLNDLLASYGGVANVPPEVRAAVTARAAQIQQGS